MPGCTIRKLAFLDGLLRPLDRINGDGQNQQSKVAGK